MPARSDDGDAHGLYLALRAMAAAIGLRFHNSLHAAQLNRSATLFRRKYYDNGSHAGFILYMTDAAMQTTGIDALHDALRNFKGPRNFRNLFMYAPNGKEDGLQLIPFSDVAAKDDFASIKNTSRDAILAAHRVPPQWLGMIPTNAGGFGDVEKARRFFMENEMAPIQAKMLGSNGVLGVEAFRSTTEVQKAPP